MQLIMGIGTAEEVALAEVKAQEQMKGTKVQGHDADPQPLTPEVEVKCPVTGAVSRRPRDRKSTRLNSSHEWISYAVFCLKKKNDITLNRVDEKDTSYRMSI